MATSAIGPGVRRCLCGIRNGNPLLKIRAELSQLVQERKRDVKNISKAPFLLQSYSGSVSSQGELSNAISSQEQFNADIERLLSLLTVKVRGSDEAVLDSYTQFVQRAATVLNLDISGKVVIPMHVEKRTLLKSPHIYKKHRVQYELRTHARMLQVRQLTGDTADIFLEYIQRNLPEGVSMSVEQTELESIPEYIQNIEVLD